MKKKILFLFPILVALFSFSNVHAFVNGSEFSEYLLLYADFQGWNSASSYTSLGTAYHSDTTGINTNNQVAYYYLPQPNLYNDTNGTSVKSYINGQIVKDNQVELSVGICSDRTIDFISSYVLYLVDSSGNFHFQSLTANTANDLGSYNTEMYTFKCKEYYMTFTATVSSTSFVFRFYSSSTKPMGTLAYMGYHLNINGIDYTSQFNNLSNQNQILINQQQITNEKIDDILDADAEPSVKPDDEKYDDYESAEGSLKDKVNQADLSNLSIGIDANSSKWVWDTLTSLLQSHSAIFGMVIAILSIGIIKLALGR